MIKPLSLQLAVRFMAARQRSKMVSFISASSTLGIAVGIIAILLVLSAMNGFERALQEKLLGVIPDAEIVSLERPMSNWQGFQQQLVALPEVEAAAPFIQLSAMVVRGAELRAVQLRGIDEQLQPTVSDYQQYLEPSLKEPLGLGQMVLGAGLADELGVEVGDTVRLMIAPENGDFKTPKTYSFEVVSLFRFGGQIDSISGFVSLQQGQLLAKQTDTVDGLELKVNDIFAASRIAYTAAAKLPIYVYVTDWTRVHGHVYKDIQMVRGVVYMVMALIIAVACFNIVSTLVMTVQDKRGEIAILLTMGTKSSTIIRTFIWQGALSGFIGVASGVALGCLAVIYLNPIIGLIEQLLGTSLLSADVYFIDHIPTVLQRQDVLLVATIAWGMAIVSTIYPAWRASKIKPARELGGH
ncbi:lipoprotein-releasing ABC transporter permease subunit [Neiella marina]|uniref:Lipoprotein-releasing ABC transporter permease subunit n=1 Tax=Neiella holothuriorum TaxID=2870530 RepID=A0ABS7EDN1_9GAMM|nr:lipoprotein-releasing ABC transporter permease subunit [Neiella holothuriorum]MBW8190334.1 lipoprotein-releasing ABC transporter permease subunit [Neiella holothuriorum]